MIISKIELAPFAGVSNMALNFSEGLNVILGPNEVGKSTIFHALCNVLFTKASLTPVQFQDSIGRFLPIGGGDTIKVALHFKNGSEMYNLHRKWGPAPEAELKLPDGNILSDESKISEEIMKCLGTTEGTC
ncbi:AAA family ATPase, partial [bacterium]|nr:AAA family ATPase [bacterium]